MMERRKQLGGSLPKRVVRAKPLKVPGDELYDELKQGSGKSKIATTMAVVRLLRDWMKDKEIGHRIVPIAPDEYRTFGMDSMFPSAKVYNPGGQRYESVDRKLLLKWREDNRRPAAPRGDLRGRRDGLGDGRRVVVLHPRRGDDPVLHLLLDVRVPAHR